MTTDSAAASLTAHQLSILRWLLPASRPGYDTMFTKLSRLTVLGVGRWGEDDLILGRVGATIDPSLPMTPVFAHGIIEFVNSSCSIAVHDEDEGQIEIQFGTAHPDVYDPGAQEIRRFCYSYWQPGMLSPRNQAPVREIHIPGSSGVAGCTLALCAAEKKIWVHESATGVNRLIAHTGFYNELMRVVGEKRSERALAPALLFSEQGQFPDRDLALALYAYNTARQRVALPPFVEEEIKPVSLFKRLFRT